MANYADANMLENAYQAISKGLDANDTARHEKLDEAHNMLSSKPRKTVYDAHLQRDKRIKNPTVVKVLSKLGFHKQDILDEKSNIWSEVIKTPLSIFGKWFSSAQVVDHQSAAQELEHFIPIAESDNPKHQKFKEAYDEIIKHESVTNKDIPLFVWNDPGKDHSAFIGRNSKTGAYAIAFDEEFLETLTPEGFKAIAAHELGHSHDPVKNRRSVVKGLELLKITQGTSKNLLFPVLAGVGMLTGATPLVVASLGVLVSTTALYTTGKTILQKMNHKEEYNADAFSAKVAGVDAVVNQLNAHAQEGVEFLPQQSWKERLFGQMSHPTFEERSEAILKAGKADEKVNWSERVENQIKESEKSVENIKL